RALGRSAGLRRRSAAGLLSPRARRTEPPGEEASCQRPLPGFALRRGARRYPNRARMSSTPEPTLQRIGPSLPAFFRASMSFVRTLSKRQTWMAGTSPAMTSQAPTPPRHAASFFLGVARARLEQTLDPALIHFGNAAGQIDNQPLSAQNILASRDHDVACQR